MLSFLDPYRGISFWIVIVKVVLSFLLGGAIGLERSYKNRPAGFRTYILVTLGAAMASMTGIYLCENLDLPADVSRISAAVVAGLGFLGAGTIIVTKNYSVKGLTTAAGLWASGVLGLAIGAGYYEGAVLATVLILLTATFLGDIANRFARDPEFRVEVVFRRKRALDQVLRSVKDQRCSILDLKVRSSAQEEEARYRAIITARPRMRVDKNKLYAKILAVAGVDELNEIEIAPEDMP